MKYKIIKKTSKSLQKVYDPDGQHIEVHKSEWYQAKRKGKIFGFWHDVGHERYFDGGLIARTEKTVEAMEDYVRKWHEVNYYKEKIEIIKDIEL